MVEAGMRTRPLLLLACLALAACEVSPRVIDSRYDTGLAPSDAPGLDGGGLDAGAPTDGGSVDGGCVLEDPPTPAAWVPVDTGGPSGESLSACLARAGSLTDNRVPASQRYDVTTFGGPGDEQPVACGGMDADGTWYYAANSQRFPCGQRVRLVTPDRGECVVVQVADLGPNACVEEAGEQPIWDVSPLAAQSLFGVTSVGYSEHRAVLGAPVGSANALGPCTLPSGPDLAGFIGGPCTSDADCSYTGGSCLRASAGFPSGTCTLACPTGSCPDRAGPFAFTGCAEMGGGPHCAARCDYTLFPTGCRAGYGCETVPHPINPSLAVRQVCLPLTCR